MITQAPRRAHTSLIRELATNLDRVMAGEKQHVCLQPRQGEPSCGCYLTAQHPGRHRCLCGAEWSSPRDGHAEVPRSSAGS